MLLGRQRVPHVQEVDRQEDQGVHVRNFSMGGSSNVINKSGVCKKHETRHERVRIRARDRPIKVGMWDQRQMHFHFPQFSTCILSEGNITRSA